MKVRLGDITKIYTGKLKISTKCHTTIYAVGEKTWMTYSKSDAFGLIKAIDNFDITQDVQFSTYRSSDDSTLVEIIHIKR